MRAGICLALALLSSGATAASFDCAKASTSVEKSICADKQLGDLDDSLAGAYKAALSASNNAESTRVRQREWLTSTRNKCPDSACIRSEYIKRLAELSYGSRSAVGELLAKAAQGAASRTPIPVYVPVSLQSLDADAEDGCAFAVSDASSFSITVYGRLTGYDKTKPLPCEENGAALIAEIHGDIKPMPDLSGRRSAQKVALPSGAAGWFLPVACGVSCTPATLYWQTPAASYSIQMKFGSAVAEARQRKELLDTANSLVLVVAPAAGAASFSFDDIPRPGLGDINDGKYKTPTAINRQFLLTNVDAAFSRRFTLTLDETTYHYIIKDLQQRTLYDDRLDAAPRNATSIDFDLDGDPDVLLDLAGFGNHGSGSEIFLVLLNSGGRLTRLNYPIGFSFDAGQEDRAGVLTWFADSRVTATFSGEEFTPERPGRNKEQIAAVQEVWGHTDGAMVLLSRSSVPIDRTRVRYLTFR